MKNKLMTTKIRAVTWRKVTAAAVPVVVLVAAAAAAAAAAVMLPDCPPCHH